MRRNISLRANVIANFAGQTYAAAINIAMVPLQIRLLGAEAFGLIGFFAMLSGWLQLLDVGLTPALGRETARFRAGALNADGYRQLLRAIELVFAAVGATIALGIFAASGLIAQRWLQPKQLDRDTIASAVGLMGLVFAFRWQATLSRSVLVGLERQVSVNLVTTAGATRRSAGVLIPLKVFGPTPSVFFTWQAGIAALEFLVLRAASRRALALGAASAGGPILAALRPLAGFSLTVSATTFVWVLLTQLDKLLLSKLLPLAHYAYFSIAVTAASGVSLLAGPIGQAIQPRLTFHAANDDDAALRSTYSDATQALSAVALTAAGVVARGSRELLWAWTGDADLAARTAPVLRYYALGNGFLAVVAVTYFLQIARGNLRLHVRGNAVFAVVLVPLVAFATVHYGMLGAAMAWCAANFAFLVVWSPLVHRRFLPGFHLRWLFRDALFPGMLGALPTLAFGFLPWSALSRFQTFLTLGALGALALGMASLATRAARRVLFRAG